MIVEAIRRPFAIPVMAMVCALSPGFAVQAAEAIPAAASAAARADEIPMTEVQLKALGVRLAAPQAATEAGTLRFPAKVMVPPTAERAVVAPLAGTVEQLLVTAGDTVRAGQPLATLFSAELSSLKASYVQMQAAERLARADRDRDTALHADGIIAARRMEETRGRHEVAAAQLAEARQRLKLAGVSDADLGSRSSAAMSAAMTLRAPQDGVVLAQAANVGERVEAGTLLFRIAKLDRLWLDVQVPVEAAARLKVGDTLRLKAPAQTQAQTQTNALAARVRSVGRDAGSGTQSVQVRAEVEAGHEALRPGQAVEVELQASAQAAGGWAVPDAAVVRDPTGTHVFTRTAAGFRAIPVNVLGRSADSSIVEGPLGASDRVAVTGIIAIKGAWTGHGGGE